MSKEKLYAVKNDEGKYWDFSANSGFWSSKIAYPTTTIYKELAEQVADERGGHVVTFVEEPKKVALSEEQAEIVKNAQNNDYPATEISGSTDDSDGVEKLLMNAFVNGYTVAKDKKYLVYKELGGKQKDKLFAQAYRSLIHPGTISWDITNEVKSGSCAQFTESEIEHYGLQDCEKEEVTDDGMGC
ncbi:DUF1642 domain-containing protein [Lacticaseibacillus paracasei]|uniref:DUF1642 domain-containing protein n=1 Tax=Lacticaseibacillus paracasei TaxID=1597 RepID=UPI00339198E7